MPQKKTVNLQQEVFDYFTPVSVWPSGYQEGMKEVEGTNIYGMDIETEGLNPYDKQVRIITFASSPSATIAMGSYAPKLLKLSDFYIFKDLLENPENILVGHNIKFDINWIRIKFNID